MLPLFVMFLGRIGSLNALDQTRKSRDWRKLLNGKELPSADTLGRVAAMVSAVALRQILVRLQRRMRQKKALPWLTDHLVALVFDGHESMSSFLRKPCGGCLERKVGKPEEERTQSYHRFVFASLVGEDFHYFVEVEPIRPGEGEVVAARRLYDRSILSTRTPTTSSPGTPSTSRGPSSKTRSTGART